MDNILDITPKDSIDKFFSKISEFRNIDQIELKDLAGQMVKGYSGHPDYSHIKDNELEKIWYKSLDRGIPDYSVYNTDIYISDLWACWIMYSRKYLREIRKPKNNIIDNKISYKKIVDLGCGFGYTTIALKQMFPDAEVIGTNIKGTTQIDVARSLGVDYNFKIVSDYKKIGNGVDLIFASEYFEHFPEPVKHLEDIICSTQAKYFLFANSFGTKSVGHFNEYIIKDRIVGGRSASTLFNKVLKINGYTNIKTQMWNNKPSYWGYRYEA